jgi:hypothetical protein
MRFLTQVVTSLHWKEQDLASYMKRGSRVRFRALGDWYNWYIAPNHKSYSQIATDPHPEIDLANTIREMKLAGAKLYRARELVTQVAAFYNNFCGKPGVSSNAIVSSILSEWEVIPKPPHKYPDVMPIEKVMSWLQSLGDNSTLNRFALYRKFLITIQLCCIARTADIFRLRFDSLVQGRPPGSLTFITTTKTSGAKGFLYYLFEIPKAPQICPARTTLAFKKSFEEQASREHWSLPPHFIHVNEKGIPLKNVAQLTTILKASYQEAGINTKKWSVNNARHAVITFYKGRGISEEQIKLITGHSMHSRVTHDFYTHPIGEWSNKSVLSVLASQQNSISLTPSMSASTGCSLSDPDFGSDSEESSDAVEILISPKSQNRATPMQNPSSAPVPFSITDLDQYFAEETH